MADENQLNPIMSASFSLTKICNLRCKHCYVSAGRKSCTNELTEQEFKDLVDALENYGVMNLQITGGEPFMVDYLYSLMSYISKKDIGIYLITNGTLLEKDQINRLKEFNLNSFQISFDSTNEQNYEEVRGVKGIFKKVKENIITAAKQTDSLYIGCVLMKTNKDDIDKVIDFAKQNKCRFSLIPLLTTGNAAEMKGQDVELKKKISIIVEKLKADKEFIIAAVIPPVFYPDKHLKKNKQYKYCSFPYHVAIMPNGDVFPCDGLRNCPELKLGNIREKSFSEIWDNSEIMKNIMSVRPEYLKGICNRCKLKNRCGGGCRAASYLRFKTFDMPDPLCHDAYENGLFPEKYLD